MDGNDYMSLVRPNPYSRYHSLSDLLLDCMSYSLLLENSLPLTSPIPNSFPFFMCVICSPSPFPASTKEKLCASSFVPPTAAFEHSSRNRFLARLAMQAVANGNPISCNCSRASVDHNWYLLLPVGSHFRT